MKKAIIIIVSFFAIIVGCRFDDGPLISFRSTYGRMYGTWQVQKFEINGTDFIQQYNDSCDCKFVFHQVSPSDRIMYFSNNQTELSAKFGIKNRNKLYIITGNGYSQINYELIKVNSHSNWEIIKLTNKSLWIKSIDNDFDNNKAYYIELNKIKDE